MADQKKAQLYPGEQFWADMQPFLFAQGYQLRPRYRPDWTPSWTAQSNPQECEDNVASFARSALDATRIHDGHKVILKRVETDDEELDTIKYLTDPSVRDDPRNRTIPLLDVLSAPDTSWSFLVMPYCRRFNHPPFHCRNEFLDAVTQFLEGLQFMHEHNIAHYDIAPQNMVMDESRVVPKGSHFARPETHNGFYFHMFTWKNRCTVGPINYYYIDFGLSMYFPEGKDAASMCGTLRTFPDIPELSATVPYNPFLVDIYQLGLTIRKLIDSYPDLDDFRPVADAMTLANPKDRPTPEASLAHLRSIAGAMTPSTLSAQIWEKDTGLWKKLCRLVLGGDRDAKLPR